MTKLVDKILEDARIKANSTCEEGNARASEILAIAENDVHVYRGQCRKETDNLRDEILRRRQSVANLEVKKLMLSAKKKKLDDVYLNVLKALQNLPKNDYLSIIESMLSLASDGDSVQIAERDKDVITSDFIKSYAAKRGISLSLANTYAKISGGIILCGKGSDKNVSFDTELEALREETESEIAKDIFGAF